MGQAAIRIARSSAEKRAFLRSTFPDLSPDHIFDSRSTEFERRVMEATEGRGADLVLNSLADDKLQASLR